MPKFAHDGYPQKLDNAGEGAALIGAHNELSTVSHCISIRSDA